MSEEIKLEPYSRLIKHFSDSSTEAFRREKLIEECSELTLSLSRLVTKEEPLENVVDEMVDVCMCIDAFNLKLHTHKMFIDRIKNKTNEILESLDAKA